MHLVIPNQDTIWRKDDVSNPTSPVQRRQRYPSTSNEPVAPAKPLEGIFRFPMHNLVVVCAFVCVCVLGVYRYERACLCLCVIYKYVWLHPRAPIVQHACVCV